MNILIADDHNLFREGISSLIKNAMPDAQLICVESLADIEVQLKSATHYHIILVDLSMPGMHGVRSIRKLAEQTTSPLLVISAEESPETMQACMSAGASGYLPKSSDTDLMLQTIQSLLAGGQYMSAEARKHKPFKISHRQEEVLMCIAEGKSNREIADVLNITEGTVKQYVSVLLRMLDVDNRTRAAAKAKKLLGLNANPEA